MLPFLFFVPVLAPLALLLVFAWRWYWVLTPRDRHSSGPIRHLLYIALMPGAVAGTILLTWLGMDMYHQLFSVPAKDHFVHTLVRWWMNFSLFLYSTALWFYASLHDGIVAAVARLGLVATDARWLPDAWFATELWSAKVRSALAALAPREWGFAALFKRIPGNAQVLLLVPGYFALSHWTHILVARAIKQERAQQERARLAAEEKQRADEAEIARIRAGGTPKLSTGKPSAMEF